MNILIVEPYFTGSHAAWAGGLKSASRNNVQILTLPGRYWKWRMHGGAITLAREFLELKTVPDLILATDMLDVTTFLALTRRVTGHIPVALYFHENQLTYPWSPGDRKAQDNRQHYGFINCSSALAADRVFFNSNYHMESFLNSLSDALKGFPDYNEVASVEFIKGKSKVLYPGMDFQSLENAAPIQTPEESAGESSDRPPLILWNHRWEYDKNPEEFFMSLYALMDKGVEFEVALLGESFQKKSNPVFDEARARLGRRVVHFGFAKDPAEYARWLFRADIIPVTSIHDFFGCSVVEAIYFGCYPILPKRLAYPEHLPEDLHSRHFYDDGDFDGLVRLLHSAIDNIDETRKTNLKGHVAKYGWEKMAPLYDKEMEEIIR